MSDSLKAELKRPASTVAMIIGLVGILAGVGVAYYFYKKSLLAGQILYQAQQVQIFDQKSLNKSVSNSGPALFLVDEKGEKIDENVYAATVRIWNAGNDEIRREDVRAPITLLIGNGRAINVGIVQQTSDAEKFAISTKLVLTWDHFDAGDGCIVRVIYASDTEQEILVDGYAARSQPTTKAKQTIRRGPREATLVSYINFMTFLFLMSSVFASLIMSMQGKLGHWTRRLLLAGVLVFSFLLSYAILKNSDYLGTMFGIVDTPPL